MVPHLKTPIFNRFYHLFRFYILTDSEFICLAMQAKPYSVSDPPPLPPIRNQLHFFK